MTEALEASVPTVLVVCSAPVEEVLAAAEAVRAAAYPGSEALFLLTARQDALRSLLESRGARIERLPDGLAAQAAATLRLRRQGFAGTLLPLTGKAGYRRLKALGFLAGLGACVVAIESGDFYPLRPAPFARHLRWRAGEAWSRFGGLLGSGWRLLRQRGPKAFLSRFQLRRRALAGRGFSRLRIEAAALLPRKIALPAAERPRVSVVIPVFNQWSFTRRCLESIAAHGVSAPFEVLLVDNASTDATKARAPAIEGLRVLRMEENLGFVGACNEGARQARGELVLFLNNDIVTTPGWLDALVRVFDEKPACGAVGARLLYPDGTLQEAGGIVWQDGSAWNCGRNDTPERPEYNYLRRVDYCSGAALLVRRDAFLGLGGFDQRFSPGYWEDTDLCFALRAQGLSVWYQPESTLYHYEGASAGREESVGMKRYQALHADRFREKWTREIAGQVALTPSSLFTARDRNRGERVLVVDHYVPTWDRDAGSLVMYRFLGSLVSLGCRVIFWPDNRFRTPRYTEDLERRGIEVRYGSGSLEEYLAGTAGCLDAAVVHRSFLAESYLPRLRGAVPALGYIAADLEHVRESRLRGLDESGARTVRELREREERIVAVADCIAVHSPVEAEVLRSELGARDVVHLPLPVTTAAPAETAFEEREGLVFLGSTHPPNVDAVRFFAAEVLPALRRRSERIRLKVVGEVCDGLRDLGGQDGVELLGYVEDLGEELSKARVFVAPLRYGAGVKGKILEAVAHGLPVVTTSVGEEGIGLVDGESALVADGAEALVEAALRLHEDPALWDALRRAGRRHVEESFSAARFDGAVRELLDRLLRAGSASAGAVGERAVTLSAARGA